MVKYAQLGKTGLVVSRLAFGSMTFGVGEFRGLKTNIDQNMANDLVAKALEAGINFFDTADMYGRGQAEQILGKALGDKRKDVVVASKVGVRMGEAPTNFGLSAHHIIKGCEDSLKRLQTDYLDLYQLHFYDHITPLEEITRALELLVKQGKVRYVGYSNMPAWQAASAVGIQNARGYLPFVSAQMYYSLLCRDVEYDIVPFLQATGLGLLVWSPLAGGFLSGKYTEDQPEGDGGRMSQFNFPPVNRDFAYPVVKKVREIAAKYEVSCARVALAWLLAKPHVTSVIVGANKMEHLVDNMGAVDLDLSVDDIQDLDEFTAPRPLYPHWMSARTADPILNDVQR